MPSLNRIHGHAVMEMMVASDKDYTHDTLKEDILTRFGPDTRFFTCSAEGMTADELITFLEQKGKFVNQGAGFSTLKEKICNH
ncbi:MAG: YecH family protein [Candidatus Marinimicrobia bacterium]|nr:YecH family protein [Candidatus Neomarinimicrobiota bacterium]MCF7904187.1 YecH family protein [Candidatus Neomarinimicrobiota bacterium]